MTVSDVPSRSVSFEFGSKGEMQGFHALVSSVMRAAQWNYDFSLRQVHVLSAAVDMLVEENLRVPKALYQDPEWIPTLTKSAT